MRFPEGRHLRSLRRLVGWTALAGGLLVGAFWLLYFSSDATLGRGDPRVAAFEAAFLIADAAFAATLFGAGYCLLRRRAPGPFLLVAAAAISLYLGLLDLTFYAGHGFYRSVSGGVVLELGVNTACVAGGLLGLRAGWRLWRGDGLPAR